MKRNTLIIFALLTLTACGGDDYYYDDDYYEEDDDYYYDEEADEGYSGEADGGGAVDNSGGDSTTSGDLPYYADSNCPAGIPTGPRIACGILYTYEDHANPNDDYWIELQVVIIAPSSGTPLPDPLVYLSGGPGSSAVLETEVWLDSPLGANREIILVDQRGTGYSYPTLNCTELDELYEDDDEIVATEKCRDRLLDEGIDLTQYNTIANATDIEELRIALGYDQWNLIGISYGTRLGLTLMRLYPDGIRSVILDSVYPPHVNAYEDQGINGQSAFKALFASCAADSLCNGAYPNLESIFYTLVDDLNNNPITVEIEDYDYEIYEEDFYGDDLVNLVFDNLYDTSAIPFLPLIISDLAAGSTQILSDFMSGYSLDDSVYEDEDYDEGDYDDSGSEDDGVDRSDSEGMFYSVDCNEEQPFNSLSTANANGSQVNPAIVNGLQGDVETVFDICDLWGAGVAPAIESEPVRSDIPTLVVAGDHDPITPPVWAQSTAQYLTNSFYHVFPGVGHGVIDGGSCPLGILVAFLNNPTVAPDASCIAGMDSPAFYIP